jgi:hypothetical protein
VEPTTEIAAFNTRLEADLVIAKLAEAGIDGFVVADNLGGTFPMMQMITGGYKVIVPESMAEEASEIAFADEGIAEAGAPRRSAVYRYLERLSPTQIFGVVALLVASMIAILYAVTQGTL